MKPRESSMASIAQRLARQALLTFRPLTLGEDAGRAFLENHGELKRLMTEVRAADLKLVPRRTADSLPGDAPVTYMHIIESDAFSMGVFLLKSGASIPLHDHPGMHGMLRIMYGKARISCFDRSGSVSRGGARLPAMLRSSEVYTEESAPCVLSPDRDNLHQIDAVDGPTAFLDILAPPYEPKDGRDCHYYQVLTEAKRTDDEAPKDKEVWLMEIPQPPEFWCGGEAYPGPEVSL